MKLIDIKMFYYNYLGTESVFMRKCNKFDTFHFASINSNSVENNS